ncbi:MAG: PEP-CTERM-box response regulator transcription factor [Candidatus Omnitrophica bacterium]|nr:PEP-CTERM-box response regulator transcription factor [Candidatus Omnitrophota bacterium]
MKLLLVDDDEGVLRQLKWALAEEYEVYTAATKDDALRLLREGHPELVTLDIDLSGRPTFSKDGIDILEEIKVQDPYTKVIMITGNDAKDLAIECIGKGAFDYYVKPVNVDDLKVMLKRAQYIQELERENRRLSRELHESARFEEMIGDSEKMREVFSLIRRVAPADATVLITGESGTGKELAARAIHYSSARKERPFIVINCGAIPENLLESELFGHEKGSFTDAHARRVGKLEVAGKGTVFLDEIGEMSLNLQVKILRFLQERVIERVGGNKPLELDVRVIAATNSDLTKKIKEGKFREDLYYRLSVINLLLPPLRERGEDVLLLASFFLQKFMKDGAGKELRGFTKEAKDRLRTYHWPGNVREMENRIRRAVILADSPLISPAHLGFHPDSREEDRLSKFSLRDVRQQAETKVIVRALQECRGNVSLAAKMLGITRPTLYDLIKKYDIEL